MYNIIIFYILIHPEQGQFSDTIGDNVIWSVIVLFGVTWDQIWSIQMSAQLCLCAGLAKNQVHLERFSSSSQAF